MTDAVERRTADLEWKESVDQKMEEGQKTFDRILIELRDNTETTKKVAQKLDDHVIRYDLFSDKLRPVVDTIETLEPGIKFFGQVSHGFTWIAKWARRAVLFLAPFGAAIAAYWQWFEHFGAGKK